MMQADLAWQYERLRRLESEPSDPRYEAGRQMAIDSCKESIARIEAEIERDKRKTPAEKEADAAYTRKMCGGCLTGL